MKKIIITTAILIATYSIGSTIINNQYQKQLQQQAKEYKQCIQQQSQTQGYIIRSQCSNNYKQLDKIANMQYKQVNYDLYLEQ